jgi:hypothetical protein
MGRNQVHEQKRLQDRRLGEDEVRGKQLVLMMKLRVK